MYLCLIALAKVWVYVRETIQPSISIITKTIKWFPRCFLRNGTYSSTRAILLNWKIRLSSFYRTSLTRLLDYASFWFKQKKVFLTFRRKIFDSTDAISNYRTLLCLVTIYSSIFKSVFYWTCLLECIEASWEVITTSFITIITRCHNFSEK